MSTDKANRIDLSKLHPAIRDKVEQALLKMPPPQREHLLRHGSPMFEKLLSRVTAEVKAQAPGASPPGPPRRRSEPLVIHRRKPYGHYNQTIQPGDRPGAVRWVLWVLGLSGLIWWWLQ